MIRVAVGLILRDSTLSGSPEILLCQRRKDGRYPLKWEFPGGKLEEGETPEACLKRELYEELCIHADVGHLYHQQSSIYADSGQFDVFYFLIPSFHGTIMNRVFESYAWVKISDLTSYDILEGNKGVAEKIIAEYA